MDIHITVYTDVGGYVTIVLADDGTITHYDDTDQPTHSTPNPTTDRLFQQSFRLPGGTPT